MANVAALKKKAADFEQKKQLDKAIAAYREILDVYDSGGDDTVDVGLYNRVGDLLVRQGNTSDAVTLYERAVDLYTEGGFFNNAIALCNKVLRTSPGRASVYYKLGKISAAKGFKTDAKQNFLEYADRMQKAGQMPEAFRALKEFADLCPDQEDIRLMLAEQLTKADKKAEALEQLQLLHERYESAGRAAEAQATVERIKAIDPSAEVKTSKATTKAKHDDDLIFIDLSQPVHRQTRRTKAVTSPKTELPPQAIEVVPTGEATPAEPPAGGSMLGLEPTAFAEPASTEPEPLAASEFAEIDLSAIVESTTSGARSAVTDLALPGDLPVIETVDVGESSDVSLSFADVDSGVSSGLGKLSIADESAAKPDVPLLELEPTSLGDVSALPSDAVTLDFSASDEATTEPATPAEALVEAAPETPTAFDTVPIEQVEEPPPVRRSSLIRANSAAALAVKMEDEPDNWALRRSYAEALLDDGNRDEGLKQLEKTLVGLEKSDDLEGARSVADEIIRLNPGSVRHHQKRVEYAFRSNDKPRLGEAYIELADALFRDGQAEKAKVVYRRVLEITPDDERAKSALEAFGPEAAKAPAPAAQAEASRASPQPTKGKRYTATMEAAQIEDAPPAPAAGAEDFVSLGDWLRAEDAPKSTRMVVQEQEPTGDEQADFADMLKKFKQGVAENVEEEDHESHYDLGVAFKEMGLVDEAIAEFQKALRGPQHRVRTCEALGQCFVEKKQYPMAVTVLKRALGEQGAGAEQLVGVLYLLGYVSEALGKHADAKEYYERVFAVDIQFRDVGDRLNAMEKALK